MDHWFGIFIRAHLIFELLVDTTLSRTMLLSYRPQYINLTHSFKSA